MAKMGWVVMMSVNWHKKKKVKLEGFTLIELMIAMMLGLIVIGGALSIYISTIKSSSDVVKSARLNYDLDSVMQLMVNDIRRAGFTGIPSGGLDTLNNAFMATATTLNIRTLAGAAADPGECILYSYDSNSDSVVDNVEYYGFKLDGGAVWVRYSGSNTTSCADGNWERITHQNKVSITALQFSFSPIGNLTATSRCLNYLIEPDPITNLPNPVTDAIDCTDPAPVSGDYIAQKRVINIVLSGIVNGDNAVLKSLSTTVEVRNHRLYKVL